MGLRFRSGWFGLGLLVASLATALAQDRAADPTPHKLLLENERVRVFEALIAPGARVALRPSSHLMYLLTDGTLVFTEAGRRPYEMVLKAGEAIWVPAQAQSTGNEGDLDMRALIVEIKAPPRERRPIPRAKGRGGKAKGAKAKGAKAKR
jgi:quercetin dioxygenase-like cupin family protein